LKILGLITARGGSKSVPGKNIKLLAGKPLLHYTAEVALKSEVFDTGSNFPYNCL
jgi:CMP-N-acetylneuraminic acid synthetase